MACNCFTIGLSLVPAKKEICSPQLFLHYCDQDRHGAFLDSGQVHLSDNNTKF